jgi:hypothetical protein
VAERDNAEGGRGRPLGGRLCGVRSICARTHTHAGRCRRASAAQQTSNKSFNKFCGSGGGGGDGGSGDGGGDGGGGEL